MPVARRGRLRLWFGRLMTGILLILAALSIASASGVLWLRAERGNAWILKKLLPFAQPVEGRLEIDEIQTDLFSYLRLNGLRIIGPDERTLLSLGSIEADYQLGGLPALLVVSNVKAENLVVDSQYDPVRGPDLSWIWGPGSTSTEPYKFPLEIRLEQVAIDSPHLAMKGPDWEGQLQDSTLHAALLLKDSSVMWTDLQLDIAQTTPKLEKVSLSSTGSLLDWRALMLDRARVAVGAQQLEVVGSIGDVSDVGHLRLAISSAHLDPQHTPPMLGDLGLPITTPVDISGRVEGDYQHPILTLALQTAGGLAELDADINLETEQWKGNLIADGLLLGALGPELPLISVKGSLKTSGQGFSVEQPDLQGSFMGRIGGLPELDPMDVSVEALLQGTQLTLSRATLDAQGLGLETAGSWNTAQSAGTLALQRLWIPLEKIQRVPKILGTIQGLPLDVINAVAPLQSLSNLQGRLSWLGILQMSPNGTVSAEGAIQLVDFRYGEDIAVKNLEGPLNLSYGPGIAGASVAGPVWLDDLLVNGDLGLKGLQSSVGDAHDGHLSLNMDRAGLGWALALRDTEREILGTAGSWSRQSGLLSIDRINAFLPKVPPIRGQAHARLHGHRVEDLKLKEIDLQLKAGDASVGLTGDLAMQGAIAMNLVVRNLQPVMIKDVAPVAGWEGVVNTDIRLGGSMENPAVEGDASVTGLLIPDAVHALNATLNLHTEALKTGGAHTRVVHMLAKVDEDLLTLKAQLPLSLSPPGLLPDVPLACTITVAPTDSGRINKILVGEPLPKLRVSAALELSGTARHPEGRLVSTVVAAPGAHQDRVQMDVDAVLEAKAVRLEGVLWEHYLPRGVLSGQIPFDSAALMERLLKGEFPSNPELGALIGNLDVDLSARKVPLRYLRDVMGLTGDFKGTVAGNLHVGGKLRKPVVKGGFFFEEAKVGRVGVPLAVLSLNSEEDGYSGQLEMGFDGGGNMSANMFVPIKVDLSQLPSSEEVMAAPGFDLKMDGALPMRLLEPFVPGLRVESGRIVLAGGATGSVGDPAPDVKMTVTEGNFSLDDTGVDYRNVAMALHVQKGQVDLENISIDTATESDNSPSTLRGKLTAILNTDWVPTSAVGNLDLDGFWLLNQPDWQVRASGATRLVTVSSQLQFKGSLKVDKANMRMRDDFFVPDAGTQLAPDIQIVGVERKSAAEADGLEGLLAQLPTWFRMILDVDLGQEIYASVAMPMEERYGKIGRDFSTVKVDGAISGILHVDMSQDRLSVTGDLAPNRGQVRVLGKTFKLHEGSIAFTGKDLYRPLLDVTADYSNRKYGDIQVIIRGTPEHPSVTFASETYAEEDVLAILLTGQPTTVDTSTEEEGGSAVASAVTQSLSNAMFSFAQDALSGGGGNVVESVQFDSMGIQGGFRIGPHLSLYTRYNFSTDVTVNPVEVSLEWTLPRDWSMDITGGGETKSISAWHTWKF